MYLTEKDSHPLLQDAIEEVADKDSSSAEEKPQGSVAATASLGALVICAHRHHGGVTEINNELSFAKARSRCSVFNTQSSNNNSKLTVDIL